MDPSDLPGDTEPSDPAARRLEQTAPAPIDPASPEMGARILEAWREGRLLGTVARFDASASPSEPVEVRMIGKGESFVAWELEAPPAAGLELGSAAGSELCSESGSGPVSEPGSAPRPAPRRLTVRIPWRTSGEQAQPLGQEAPALAHVPASVGPRPVAVHSDAASSPLGVPCLVTTFVPGRVLDPAQWTPAHLRAHARSLAELHRGALPGRGLLSSQGDGTGGLARGPMSILAEVDGAFDWWREHEPGVTELPENAALMAAAREVCARCEPAFAGLTTYVLAHGDACVTNIVWEEDPAGHPTSRFIDFEWAQADDRARDVAIIGGPVHGGPWYVPMDLGAVDSLVEEYVAAARAMDPGLDLDAGALRIRRDAWEAYERTAMLLHVTRRAQAGDPLHRAALPVLRETLAARLQLA